MLKSVRWVAVAMIAVGCGFRDDKLSGTFPSQLNPNLVLGYQSLRSLVFAPHCIGCHGSNGGVNLETYDAARSVADRIRNEVAIEKSMPPSGPISSEEQAAVNAWVLAGAPEEDVVLPSASPSPLSAPAPGGASGKTSAPTTGATPNPWPTASPTSPAPPAYSGRVRFAEVNARVFAPYCASCHGRSGGVDLRDYRSVVKNLARVRSAALTRRIMPPAGPLATTLQSLLKTWINQGAPQ